MHIFLVSFPGHFVSHLWGLYGFECPKVMDDQRDTNTHSGLFTCSDWTPVFPSYSGSLPKPLARAFSIVPICHAYITGEETEMSYLSCGCHQHVHCLCINEIQVTWHRQLLTVIGQGDPALRLRQRYCTALQKSKDMLNSFHSWQFSRKISPHFTEASAKNGNTFPTPMNCIFSH